MKQRFTLLSLLLLMTVATMPAQAAKKCADFRTQAQAQAHYKSLKRANKTGWKSLDRNKDGVACECLKKKTCSKSKKKSTLGKKHTRSKIKAQHESKPKKLSNSKSYKRKSTRTKTQSRHALRKNTHQRKRQKSSK